MGRIGVNRPPASRNTAHRAVVCSLIFTPDVFSTGRTRGTTYNRLTMAKMTDKQLAKWERTRNVGDEIVQGLRDLKAGRASADSYAIVRAREKSRLTQAEFAKLLGVSVRTLQDWEQGRREPNAAAQTLIRVAEKHPKVLRDLVG